MAKKVAMEAMFDAEATAEKLLDQIKANVEANVNTIDDAAALETKLSQEAAEFNAYLVTLDNAQSKLQAGEITPEQAVEECAPAVQALKEKCTALNLSGVAVAADDITTEEIAMLKEVISGSVALVAARKKELQDGPEGEVVATPDDAPAADDAPATEPTEETPAGEGFLASLVKGTPATEASYSAGILKSKEVQTANALYTNGRKLCKSGNMKAGVEMLEKAKKLYESAMKKALKEATRTTDMKHSSGIVDQPGFTNGAKLGNVVFGNYHTGGARSAVRYLNDRITSCEAVILKYTNKNEKREIKQIKADIKAKRKSTPKYVREAYSLINEFDNTKASHLYKQVAAMESIIDAYATEEFCAGALEATGADEASASKIKQLAATMKKCKQAGDTAGYNKAKAARDKELAALKAEAKAAKTPAEVNKAKKKLKIALIAAGATAAAFAAAAAGTHILATKGEGAASKKAVQSAKDYKAASDKKSDVYYTNDDAEKAKLEREGQTLLNKAQREAKQAEMLRNGAQVAQRYDIVKAVMDAAEKVGGSIKSGVASFKEKHAAKASPTNESVLSFLIANEAEGEEGTPENLEDVEVELGDGKAFDDETPTGEDMIEDATECDDCPETVDAPDEVLGDAEEECDDPEGCSDEELDEMVEESYFALLDQQFGVAFDD